MADLKSRLKAVFGRDQLSQELEDTRLALEDSRTQLQKAEVNLEESEARFRSIFNHSPDGLLLIDPISWTIVDCNQAYCRMNGYEYQDLVGKSIEVVNARKDPHDAYLRELRQKSALHYETVHKRKDGSVFPVEISTNLLVIAGKEYILGIDRDITDRKQSETELQQANLKLNAWIIELEERSQQSSTLNEMGNFLQSCSSSKDAYSVAGEFSEKLFSGQAGTLYMLNSSRNMLESVTSWGWDKKGDWKPTQQIFTPDDCWALRRGHQHLVDGSHHRLLCPHLIIERREAPFTPYICVPLTAQNDMFGLFHVQFCQDQPVERICQMVVTVVERLSLTLANLKLRESLKQQSIRDPLTNLFNRRYMEETLDREFSRAARHKRPLSVILMDFDNFKTFNDQHGHDAGDVLLKEFGRSLQRQVRGEDVACRFGGEEFLLILAETNLEDACRRANQIREEMKNLSIPHQDQNLGPITISAGIACYPEHGDNPQTLLRMADMALYRAKQAGRNCIQTAL